MQVSLQRRQRHRRNGAARRGRGGGAGRRIALAIPLILFSSFLVLGAVGFVAAVSAYAFYSKDLPDPQAVFANLAFDQPSVIYDRTGKIELARFGERQRQLVQFSDIPPELIDATTSIEDKDFWSNPGFDFGGFISASIDTLTGHPRGGSTITQQLVRQRLLPDSVLQGSVYDRKIREIIQSIRLTQAFPGQDGKQKIVQAYLNQNFYGNQSYGIKAAALGYFGKDLKGLTLAQDAILAAIPQSPTAYDLVTNAVQQCSVPATGNTCPAPGKLQLVVPATTEIVQRRNYVLELMKTRSVLSGANHTTAEYDAAMQEPVILTPQGAPQWKAPQFVYLVRQQLSDILCGVGATTCEKLDTGGYQVTTSLDWKMQKTVDKWTYAFARSTQAKTATQTRAILKSLGIPQSDWYWIVNMRGKNVHNAASAVIDYRTGQVLAYDGSAGYYVDANDKKFQPQFDVLSNGWRQPGSAIKPLNYVTGLDDHTLTASTMFMDVVTDFGTKGNPYTPADADNLERGPVRLRAALQFSINIPSIKAAFINGFDHLFQRFQAWGLTFPGGTVAVPSMAIGTLDIHIVDLLSAFGGLANSGTLMPRTNIVQVRDASGQVIYPQPDQTPKGKRVATDQASYIIDNILEGNTIPSVNAYWGKWEILDKGKRRPAGYKTGTTDNNKDQTAFGFVAPPTDPKAPAIAVGVWIGNSDNTAAANVPSTLTTAPLWHGIINEITKGMPISEFKRPPGLVDATVDAWSGLLPGPGTTSTIKEMYIAGTVPTQKDNIHVAKAIDSATNLLWQDGCAGPMVNKYFLDFSQVEARFPQWQRYTQEWAARAARGPGVVGGPRHTATTYFFDGNVVPFGRTWGGKFAPTDVCSSVAPPTCAPSGGGPSPSGATPAPCPSPTSTSGNPHHTPSPSPLPTAGVVPSPRRRRRLRRSRRREPSGR